MKLSIESIRSILAVYIWYIFIHPEVVFQNNHGVSSVGVQNKLVVSNVTGIMKTQQKTCVCCTLVIDSIVDNCTHPKMQILFHCSD